MTRQESRALVRVRPAATVDPIPAAGAALTRVPYRMAVGKNKIALLGWDISDSWKAPSSHAPAAKPEALSPEKTRNGDWRGQTVYKAPNGGPVAVGEADLVEKILHVACGHAPKSMNGPSPCEEHARSSETWEPSSVAPILHTVFQLTVSVERIFGKFVGLTSPEGSKDAGMGSAIPTP
jgi:hypothetical protein